MVKNLVRVLVRTARTWLHENEAQTETMPQVKQYLSPIRWCAEMLRQNPERPNYAWALPMRPLWPGRKKLVAFRIRKRLWI